MKTLKFTALIFCLCLSYGLKAQQTMPNTVVQLQKKTLFSETEFTHLDIDRIGKVVLAYGPVSKVEIEGPAEDLPTIKAKQSGQKVTVRTKSSVAVNNSTLYITLNCKKLKLDVSTVGSIQSMGTLPIETIDIVAVSIGSIQMDLESERLTLNGKALGDVVLAGDVTNSKFKIDAIGSLDCSAMEADGAQVHMKASTDIKLKVSTFLELDLYACPSISVIGDPIVKVIHKDPQVNIETVR